MPTYDKMTENQKTIMKNAYEHYLTKQKAHGSRLMASASGPSINLADDPQLYKEYNALLDEGMIGHMPRGMTMHYFITDIGVTVIKKANL